MWVPKMVHFEEKALHYERGQRMLERFKELNVPVAVMGKGNRVSGLEGETPLEMLAASKRTLAVRVRNTKSFETCKPSAHYQLPLASSCPGKCEYCYLYTNLGKKPYLRTYVNVEEILARAEEYIKERLPETTVFEGAATSDPIPMEPFSGALADTITFFGRQEYGRFRFVTKFTQVDELLKITHNQHTRFRFSVNSDRVIKAWEHGTPRLEERLQAAVKVAGADYPLGLIIAPVLLEDGWQEEYRTLFERIAEGLHSYEEITLEIILHRFTTRAKSNIYELFPNSTLPMDEEERRFKYGQFGYGKYVYPKEIYAEAEAFFLAKIKEYLPKAEVEYLV